jgi:hypothetical protein
MTSIERVLLKRFVVLMSLLILLSAAYRWAPLVTGHVETMRNVLLFLLAGWSVLFGVEFLRMVAAFIALGTDPSSLMTLVSRHGFVYAVIELFRRKKTVELRYGFLATMWGLGIFLLVGAAAYTGQLDMMERVFVDETEFLQSGDSTVHARILAFSTPNGDPSAYLRGLVQLAHRFDELGVRELVFEWPDNPHLRRDELRLVDSLKNCRIGKVFFFHWNPETHAEYLQNAEKFMATLRERSFAFTDRVSRAGPGFFSWYPVMIGGNIVWLDAGLAAVGKLRGYPEQRIPECRNGRVMFGDMTIPVTDAGEAVSARTLTPRRAFLDVVAEHHFDPDNPAIDTIVYFAPSTGIEYPNFPAELSSEVRDRIVVVSWAQGRSSGRTAYVIANIIESLIHPAVYTQYKRLPVLMAALVILISALLGSWLKPRRAMIVILLGGVGLLVLGLWLLISWNVILPMAYAFVAAILSGIAFPLLRLANDRSLVLLLKTEVPGEPVNSNEHSGISS